MSGYSSNIEHHEQAIDPQLLTGVRNVGIHEGGTGFDAHSHFTGGVDDYSGMPPTEDADMGDLFGDEEEEEEAKDDGRQSSATPSLPPSDADGLSASERRRRREMEYEEEDEPQGDGQVVELSEAYAQIPNLPLPVSSDNNYWILRLPSFIKLEPHPFDPDTYQEAGGENDEATMGLTNREKSMGVKLEVENTIRWRWVKARDGTMRKQSNSRIIRWSDGTMSLQLGKELFDVSANIDLPSTMAPRPQAGSQGGSQDMTSVNNISRNQGLTYLFAQHVRAELLQAEAAITGTLSLRPTGMQSETHRKLVKAVGQKHTKVTRLMMAPDPTKESEQERAEQLKASKRATPRRRKAAGDGLPRRRPNTSRPANKKSRGMDWSDEDQSDEEEDFNSRRMGKTPDSARKPRAHAGEYETDGFLVDDDEDEAPTKRGDDGADSLDEADEAIERAQQARKKDKDKKKPRRSRDDEDDDDDDDDDAQGHDEDDADAMAFSDEEAVVRPAGGRKTRRLPIGDWEDE